MPTLSDPIAIVGFGCVLPKSRNPDQFWENCLSGLTTVSPISKERWDSSLYLTSDRFDVDKTYSVLAGEIDPEVYLGLEQKFGFKKGEASRLELLLLESLLQALGGARPAKRRAKVGFVLGLMNPDEEHYVTQGQKVDQEIISFLRKSLDQQQQKIIPDLEKMIAEKEASNPYSKGLDRLVASEILERVSKRFEFSKVRYIVDAACASGLASIEQCCQLLSSKDLDMAVAGGAETNLSPGSFSLFSRVGGLAVKSCLPFDERSEGLIQGEGAALVVLKRLSDAQSDGDQIHAVIHSIDGSSDGRTSSLFQPNQKGQILALSRTYQSCNKDNISYIEGHGTGTPVGDRTEVASISEFFKDSKITMGSVKALTGHTKAAAGAANVIKGIYILKSSTVPPLKYIEAPIKSEIVSLPKNAEKLNLNEKSKIGISAFGFGGINYHAVLGGAPSGEMVYKSLPKAKKYDEEVYIVSSAELSVQDFQENWFTSSTSRYRLPPQSIAYIDKFQLLAVRVAEMAMEKAHLKIEGVVKDETMVISSSYLGLDIVNSQTRRVRATMMLEAVKKYVEGESKQLLVDLIKSYREKSLPFSEDSAAGVLNNVIAGRVCNAFDFHGKSFNIESAEGSDELLYKLAHLEIEKGATPLIFLIKIFEEKNSPSFEIRRDRIRCEILCSASYARTNFIKPEFRLKSENYLQRQPDLTSHHWGLVKELYASKDFSQSVLLFPGQGTVQPNRYVNYIGYSKIFNKNFELADKLAKDRGFPPISELAFQETQNYESIGPTAQDVLAKNLFQYTVEATLFEMVLERGLVPTALLGHSFGEIPALYCAGLFSFERGFEVVCLREEVSPEPGDLGALVAVAASEQKVLELQLDVHFNVANINSKEQVVLAVESKNLTALMQELRKNRVAAKELRSIGRPYHSPLMAGASQQFKKRLLELDWMPAVNKYNFLSSVTGEWFPEGTRFLKEKIIELLSQQLVNPLNFQKQLQQLRKHNFYGVIELGVDSTLSNFARLEIGDCADYRIVTAEDFLLSKKTSSAQQKTFKLKNNKYVEMVANIVSTVTGYKVEEIKLEQLFEEDLRIDSIKKAEIFFRCLEGAKIISNPSVEISGFKHVGDIVEFFQENEHIISEKNNLSLEVKFSINELRLIDSPYCNKVVKNPKQTTELKISTLLSSENISLPTIVGPVLIINVDDDQNLTIPHLRELLQKISLILTQNVKSEGVEVVILFARDNSRLFKGLRSFLRSIRLELENSFFFKTVRGEERIFRKYLNQEIDDLFIFDIVWENEERKTPAFREITEQETVVNDSTIFSVGGTKGILKQFYSDATMFGQNIDLIVCGRAEVHSAAVLEAMALFKEKYRTSDYISVDAQKRELVFQLMKKVKSEKGGIDFLINASGKEMSRRFADKSSAEIEDEISSKLVTAYSLSDSLNEANIRPKKQIYFNSVAALYGNHGQSVYAFTNGYLSGFKDLMHFYWPPVDGLGMTENLGILMKLRLMGADLLPRSEVSKYLSNALSSNVKSNAELFVLSPRNHFAMNIMSVSSEVLFLTFGEVLFKQSTMMKKTLDKTKSSYLSDHIVNGNCISPGSMGLATFMLMGKVFFQKIPIGKNFEMFNFILLDRGAVEINTSIHFLDFNHVKPKISSKYDHYAIDLHALDETDLSYPLVISKERKYYKEFDMFEFYSKKFIDYGPSFQVLERVLITESREILASCKWKKTTRTGALELDVLTSIYEACVQTAATKCLIETNGLTLPLGIERVEHIEEIKDEVLYLTTGDLSLGQDEYNFSTNVYAYNQEFKLVLVMMGVRLKKFIQLKELPLLIKEHKEAIQYEL